jgi:hypothetical protein
MQLVRRFLLVPWLAVSLLSCDSGKTDAKADPPPPEVTPVAPTKPPAVEPAMADPHADLVLDEMKDWYGLKVPEVDGWKPSWEPDTVGIQWSKPGNVDVSMVLVDKPIEKVEDIERGFMAGTKLSNQDPPTKTTKGWYTIVTTDDGKTKGFVHVRNIGKSWLACDTLVSRDEGDDRPVVPTEMLVKICESAEPG